MPDLTDDIPSPAILRLSRTVVTASVAFFFSLVVFGNLTDFGSNWQFVQHVLSMDTTFQSPSLMWRAITSEGLQLAAYWLIIGWQGMTTVLLWLGVARMWKARNAGRGPFLRARNVAVLGLTAGLLLYGFGFLGVAGEWFAMWQSEIWNGQATAGIFIAYIGLALIWLCGPEDAAPMGP